MSYTVASRAKVYITFAADNDSRHCFRERPKTPLAESMNEYSEIRHMKLKDVLYPSSVLSAYEVSKDESIKEQAKELSIPEFRRFNIVESDIRNVM